MSKRILIVGGTGFIGHALSKKCISLGWSVTSLSTKKVKKNRKLDKILYKYCDISKKRKLQKILKNKKFDYVVNLGGYVDHSKNLKTYKSHYIGCKNLVDIFSDKNSVKKFIQMGSSLEYGSFKSPHNEMMKYQPEKLKSIYSKSKLLASNFLLKSYKEKNFPITIFRLYLTYGPGQDINRLIPIAINNCLKNHKFATSKGSQIRDFIYIDDVIKILIRSLRQKNTNGQIFNLGSGKPTSVKKIINEIVKLTKMGNPIFGKIKLRLDEKKKIYPDIRKIKKTFSIKKFVDISTGLKKTIKHYQNNGI